MESDDGVAPVIGTAEKLRQLGLRHLAGDLGNFGRRFAERFFALFILGDLEKKTRLFEPGPVFFPRIDYTFESGLFFEDALGFFAVAPEIRLRGQSVQLLAPLLFSLDVKAASATVRVALRGESVVLWFLLTFLCSLDSTCSCDPSALSVSIPVIAPGHKAPYRAFFPNDP
jgi:hypothetical protein